MAASKPLVEQWDVYEVSLPGPSKGNPFVDVELSARFTREDETVDVHGFYDGDGVYRIRFMPPRPGEWHFETTSNHSELNRKTGYFTCVAPSPNNHGPVRVSNTFHFAYADGTPYRQIGTTCYAWSHQTAELQEQTLASLKSSPFNKLRMCLFPKWYAYNRGEPPLYPFEGTAPNRWDFTRFNAEFFRLQEKRIAQLMSLGIEADLILFHPYDEGHWGFDRMDAASDDRYLRYVVARFAAYRNVWWSMANEFDFMKEKKPADWDRYFQIVKANDPYAHLRSIHNARLIYDNNQPWVTHASIQNGSAVEDFGRAMLYRDVYRKPVVFDEVKYEGNLPERWGDLSAEEMVHRFWQGTIAGTYVGHGETYKHPQQIIWWACGGTLHGQSPPRLAFLKSVLEDAPAKGLEPIDKWQDLRTCGQPGEYYLVYLGKERPTEWFFELPRNELSAGMHFQVEVLDTWNMTVTPVDGIFTIVVDATYRYHAEGLGKVKLPGRPYIAIRIRRVQGDSVKHVEGAEFMANRVVLIVWASLAMVITCQAKVTVDPQASPRIQYGAEKIEAAIEASGIQDDRQVIVGTSQDERVRKLTQAGLIKLDAAQPGHEGFNLTTCSDGAIAVVGSDDSGALYGCMELASRTQQTRKLPTELHFTDAPVMKLRGTCIGLQKTSLLPGRHVYEYPITPELFPFFYDKSFWQEYLDFLASNRMNALFLWSGHPFASLVKVTDYPYAVEVPQDVFEKNVAMYRYIVTEADKRGIRIVQMFYSILLSKPFAEKNGLETQLAAPVPIAGDYTRKSIAEFVRQYPNVGLMVCLGEALQGQENQNRWLIDVILPGVKDGMKAAGLTDEIPVVVRTHATDLRQTMPDALKVYKNLFTEAKFNGESLTTWEPRGKRQEVHQAMSRLGTSHLINVHILANLEPFRYGAPRFIQKCVQAGRDRLGAGGLHLYPLFYWNWPDSPDVTDPPLKQWERDWIWFEAWARYSWNPDIPAAEDRAYWIARLTDKYGAAEAAAKILDAYNDSGECAPRILRRFGITEGNRQTMSLGMTLDELVDPDRYKAFDELWESQSPPGERLQEYVRKEHAHEPHEGETPPQIINEVLDFSARAVAEIDAAAPDVTKDHEEFARLQNDVHCIRAMSLNYAAKANAALCVLRYGFTNDVTEMEKAEKYLAESLEHYRELTGLTEHTYRFANSMQTRQRKIPVPGGVDGKPANYHWSQMLPQYEQELMEFQQKIAGLRQTPAIGPAKPAPRSHEQMILDPGNFQHYVDRFNADDVEDVVNLILNSGAWDWMTGNIPLFTCPDSAIEEIYYYRWWTFRKHIKQTPAGRVITEFILPVKHAGAYNTVSCALGHHIAEGRWLRDTRLLDEWIEFWFRGNEGKPQPHFHKYSQWIAAAVLARARVTGDVAFAIELLDDLVSDYRAWEAEKLLPTGLFWQYDVWDGMEESISGSRTRKNIRPTINSYMYGNALAISEIAHQAGRMDLAVAYAAKGRALLEQVQAKLWDPAAQFFKVMFEDGALSNAREAIGFVPWAFNLPQLGREQAWEQLIDPEGFWAPFGITTAERRHAQFRSHGVGHCEWDGAVWPFATSQTLVALANVLRYYPEAPVTRAHYLQAMKTYAQSHRMHGKPYIGEYLDETTGEWLKGDNPRSRYYNHSTFADLVITGLVGLMPTAGDDVLVDPLLPPDAWDWFCLDDVHYQGKRLTILWDRNGQHFGQGAGLSLWTDGKKTALRPYLGRWQ